MSLRVLVTGATGFVGTHIIPVLQSKGYDVTCLVRNREKAKSSLPDNVIFWEGDVTQADSLRGIADGIDYVIHLAAVGHVSAVSDEAFRRFVETNEKGTKNLVNEFAESKQLKRFIHFSSTAAMGAVRAKIQNEESVPNPVTPYQKSKKRSEEIIVEAYKEKEFPGIILRPCMIYGPGGYGEFYKFCTLMKKGLFPKVGLGKNLTPLVYIDDVVEAAVLAMERGAVGEIYIIASSQSVPLDYLRDYIVGSIGINPPYIYVPCIVAVLGARCIEMLSRFTHREPIVTYRNIKSTITDRVFDITKSEEQIGYRPRIFCEDGVKTTIRWYKEIGAI